MRIWSVSMRDDPPIAAATDMAGLPERVRVVLVVVHAADRPATHLACLAHQSSSMSTITVSLGRVLSLTLARSLLLHRLRAAVSWRGVMDRRIPTPLKEHASSRWRDSYRSRHCSAVSPS